MKKYFLFITILLLSIIFFNSYLTSRKFIEGNTTLSDAKIEEINTIIGELIVDNTFFFNVLKIWIDTNNIEKYNPYNSTLSYSKNIINLIKNIGKELMYTIKTILENMNNQDFVITQMSKIQNIRDDMQNIHKFIIGELSQINPSADFLNFVDNILTTINKEKISTILSITGDISVKGSFQEFLPKLKATLNMIYSNYFTEFTNDFTEFKNKLQEKFKDISDSEINAYFEIDDNDFAYIKTNLSFM
tara:strand:- start:534 stop:1271 length:738 start_codon:yes stop_codon:yes gene_type:complete